MASQKGKDLLLKLDDGNAAFVTVAGLRARRIAFNTQTIDATDSQSAGQWRELLAGSGIRRVSVSGSGIFKDAPSDAIVRQAFFEGASPQWQLVIPDFGIVTGAFQITDLDYTVYDTARIDIHELSARYGFAQPAMNAGNGWGADLGITYERTMDEVNDYRPHRGGAGCTPQRYRYRIGLSLVDLGGIRFARAEAGTINAGSLSIPDHDDMRVRGIEGIDSVLAGATNWTRTNGLRMGLPTGISLQYDQRLADFAYIGLAAVHPLSGRNSMRLRRANAIALTPRLETRYAELAVPIVLHEFDLAKPTVGFMLRLHGLVVGTDHILPFISKRDVHALDLYVRVRWMIFRSPACGNGKRTRTGSLAHRSGSKDMVPCTIPGSGK